MVAYSIVFVEVTKGPVIRFLAYLACTPNFQSFIFLAVLVLSAINPATPVLFLSEYSLKVNEVDPRSTFYVMNLPLFKSASVEVILQDGARASDTKVILLWLAVIHLIPIIITLTFNTYDCSVFHESDSETLGCECDV